MRAQAIILSLVGAAVAAAGLGAAFSGAARERAAGVAAQKVLLDQNEALLSFANKVARGEAPKAALESLAVENGAKPATRGDLIVYGPLVARAKDGAIEAICVAAAPPDHPCADFVEAREPPPHAADRNN